MSSRTDPFFQACGGTDPIRLEVYRPDGAATTAEFHKPFVLVGRDSRADLTLPDPDAAARQLYLQLVGGQLFGVQLSDRTAVFADGRSWECGWLRPGDELAIGRVRLRVAAADAPADPPAPGPAGGPAFQFETPATRSNPPRRFTYQQDLVLVGRTAPSEFLVRHPDVSRCHAAVVRTPAGLWVVDLLSRTGVGVNGAYGPAAAVRDGDELALGRVRVRVRVLADEPAGPDPVALVPVPPPDPILDQVAALQKHTFEQFQELFLAMMQMVGGILNEQREFVKEELSRLERLSTPGRPAPAAGRALPAGPAAPPPAGPAPPRNGVSHAGPVTPPPSDTPRPTAGRPQVDEVQLHAWLEQRLGTLNQQQSAVWDRLMKMLKGG
jgi:pSer/pThr/pTyr-binding forkhead associated (FHA) protein